MNIQSINHSTAFKGLYTNKKYENGGNWLIEYQPYSWEMKNDHEFGSAPQTELDLFDKTLPDNEKIFTPAKSYDQYSYQARVLGRTKYGREFCEDILGTTFYYTDYDSQTKRTDITKKDALNRENSLKVLANKLQHFADLKQQKIEQLQKEVYEQNAQYVSENINYDRYSDNYDMEFWKSDKNNCKASMDDAHQKGRECVSKIIKSYDDIISLNKSIEDVKEQKETCLKEIGILEEARKNGKLIDISVRTKYDPNRVLWEELQKGVQNVVSKIIALPHKTISMKSIFSKINLTASNECITKDVIAIVDKMIKAKI